MLVILQIDMIASFEECFINEVIRRVRFAIKRFPSMTTRGVSLTHCRFSRCRNAVGSVIRVSELTWLVASGTATNESRCMSRTRTDE